MARFVWFMLLSIAVFGLYVTKPTKEDFYQKLQDRAETIASVDHDAFFRLRGADPVDEMVAAASPFELLEQTRVDDYFVLRIFTTEYSAPGHRVRRVRTYGIFSTLISSRDN